MSIFLKNARCLKSNWKAAAYAAKGRFCYAHRAVVHQRQQDSPQEKGQKQKHRKGKNQQRFPCRIGGRRSAEIAAFLLLSNNKDPSLKKNFKGPSEKIFLLTLPSNNSRRSNFSFCLKSVRCVHSDLNAQQRTITLPVETPGSSRKVGAELESTPANTR